MEQEILTQLLLAEVQANEERQGNLLQNYEGRFELPEDQKLSKLGSEANSRKVEVGQFFYALPSPNGAKNRSLCREYKLLRDEKRKFCIRVDRKRCTIRPYLGHKKFAEQTEDTALKFKFHLYSKIKPLLDRNCERG